MDEQQTTTQRREGTAGGTDAGTRDGTDAGTDGGTEPGTREGAGTWTGTGGEVGAGVGATAGVVYGVTALALVASGLVHLAVFAVDGGPWNGPVSWRKPVTFGLSFGVTLWAVVRVTSFLRMSSRVRTALLGAFAADCVVEVGGITLQAWRKVPSHLDMETPFDTAVSMTLAVGGGVLVALLTVFAVASFRRRPTGPAGMALAVRSGFAILLVALASGAVMIARGVVLTRTGHQEAAYHSIAPLKPLHGVSLHAVLVLPALAWLMSSRTSWSEKARWRITAAAVACYAAAVVAAAVWAVLAY
ncbi:hypothetical protein [Streptomyces sp. FL07-04A]|uniref:hypothetical protein n=1 Tax=Streptomyces sp. FL07-04A TaxID=3028658 RepID=UPI0029A9AF63|nr:hypothetical protein [Streptomyces sp. FL07-04A]MDX3577036.1 hypothetical protein [Streptomyces sp. FL07-04A]